MSDRVVRVWKGYGSAEGVERYSREHFAAVVLPGLRALDGFVGARALVRPLEDETELVVATVWESMDAVRAFAGDGVDRAVVEPVVRELLDRFDDRVAHFAVALETGAA
jgi:heme-degrading monooxygenase HmoA